MCGGQGLDEERKLGWAGGEVGGAGDWEAFGTSVPRKVSLEDSLAAAGVFFLTTPMVIGPLKQTKAGNVWEDKDKPVNQLWPWLLLG